MPPTLKTCETSCGCECDYDVEGCRDFRAALAHREAHEQIVQQAYDLAYARSQSDNNEN